MPSSRIPTHLRTGDDASEDVTAPDRAGAGAAQYMNQSIFSMIAAAGSRRDFHTRFDESSESESEQEEQNATPAEIQTASEVFAKDKNTPPLAVTTATRHKKQLSKSSSKDNTPQLLLKDLKTTQTRDDSSPSSEATTRSSGSNPHDAPMMSRLLTAEFQAIVEDADTQGTSGPSEGLLSRAVSSPATLLATRLKEIFGFETAETVIAEYPCWLLQSVLLQGYLYLTRSHVCFYAYLPRKSHVVVNSGHLLKKARSTGKYHRYWYTLKGDVLSYYTDPSDLYFPQGNIDLRYGISANLAAEKSKQKECRDITLTTDHRTYQFRADTPSSARDWVKSLQKTIFRSHNDGDSVKISLPVGNIIDLEVSPVVEFAETVKLRVIESEQSYAIDDVS